MERETGIEPVTSSLGSWRSTAELLPLRCERTLAYHSEAVVSNHSAWGAEPGSGGPPRGAVATWFVPAVKVRGHSCLNNPPAVNLYIPGILNALQFRFFAP